MAKSTFSVQTPDTIRAQGGSQAHHACDACRQAKKKVCYRTLLRIPDELTVEKVYQGFGTSNLLSTLRCSEKDVFFQ